MDAGKTIVNVEWKALPVPTLTILCIRNLSRHEMNILNDHDSPDVD